MKIVWVCPLDFSRFSDRLSFHAKPTVVVAPWMTLLTEIFEEYLNETELHVISAPPRLASDTEIIENGIHYHFISNQLPFTGGKMPFVIKRLTRYRSLRKKIKNLVDRLNPDVIEFHGAEHDLSWAFFDLDYPKILTPQFFVNNYYDFRPTKYLRYWMKVEENIYTASTNFSYRNEHMKREILKLKPTARLYKYQYPIKKPTVHATEFPIKDADIVFTARLIKSKGIEDLLQALKSVKREIPAVKAKIIGQCSKEYMEILKEMSRTLAIEENVVFLGFISTQEAMFKEVAKSRLSVLPTHFDLIPGSVLEAMFIGTPVLAYAAGGLPELNEESEALRLVEVGNIDLLSKEIIALLKDEKERKNLEARAKEVVLEKFNNNLIYKDMILAYNEIIKHYSNNKDSLC